MPVVRHDVDVGEAEHGDQAEGSAVRAGGGEAGVAQVSLALPKRRVSTTESTEQVAAVPPRARTTARLRQAVAEAVADNRCVTEVARTHRVSWPTVQRAVNAMCGQLLGEPAPTRLLGIDETRFRRPRWHRDGDGRWQLVEPWETGFV